MKETKKEMNIRAKLLTKNGFCRYIPTPPRDIIYFPMMRRITTIMADFVNFDTNLSVTAEFHLVKKYKKYWLFKEKNVYQTTIK